MKAAVWNEEGRLDVVDRTLPELEAGWARLRVGAAGICGTDLHFLAGGFPSPAGLQPGHEIAGTVEAAGDGAGIARGTRVAVEPLVSCQHCPSCLTGNYNRCPEGRLFGMTARGGMAELVDIPALRLHPLPDRLSLPVGALCEPLAVCVRAIRLARIGLGDTVVILGAGTIGLLCIPTARAAGAGSVLVTARHPHQAEQARALGASGVYADGEALVRALGESAADVVVETVGGRAKTLEDAVRIARPGARIAMMGVFEGAASLPALPFSMKELALVASYCYGYGERESDFARAVRLAGTVAAAIAPLVTHTFPLDRVNEAFATALDKGERSIKVQVNP